MDSEPTKAPSNNETISQFLESNPTPGGSGGGAAKANNTTKKKNTKPTSKK